MGSSRRRSSARRAVMWFAADRRLASPRRRLSAQDHRLAAELLGKITIPGLSSRHVMLIDQRLACDLSKVDPASVRGRALMRLKRFSHPAPFTVDRDTGSCDRMRMRPRRPGDLRPPHGWYPRVRPKPRSVDRATLTGRAGRVRGVVVRPVGDADRGDRHPHGIYP